MSKLAADHATIVKEQVARVHAAVNDGTLDRDTVNDALAKLTVLTESPPEPVRPTTAETRAANRAAAEDANR